MKKNAAESGLVVKKYKKRSLVGGAFHTIRKRKATAAGLIIFAALIFVFLASLFIRYDAIIQGDVRLRLIGPGLRYPFGTDNFGRNAFLRVIYGTRYSLAIGFGGSFIAAFFGVTLGAVAGYYGKATEILIMRFSEVLSSIPGLLLAMVIMTVVGNNLTNLIFAVGVTAIPIYIRMTRATILTIRDREYIEAARAIGLPVFRIIFRHVLPNGLSPIIVTFSANFGIMIITAASLAYVGISIPIPLPEWGSMIESGRDFARAAPYIMMFPGLFIMVTVLASNLLGDGLRDALDPKLR